VIYTHEVCLVSRLQQQFQDFALGIALIFWGIALIGLVRMFRDEPRQTAAKLSGSLAWFFTLLAILWTAHLSDKYL